MVLIFSLVLIQWPYISLLYVDIWKAKYKRNIKDARITIPDQLVKFINKYGEFTFEIIESNKIFGYVKKDKSVIYLSSAIINKFDADTCKYILAHELGHLHYNHFKKREKKLKIVILVIFSLIIIFNTGVWITILLAIILALIIFKILRREEDEADFFAVKELGLKFVTKQIKIFSTSSHSQLKWLAPFMYHRRAEDKILHLCKTFG